MVTAFALVSFGSIAGADDCSPQEYLRMRPDVQAAGMNPWNHYVSFGFYEGMCTPNGDYRCTPGDYFELRPDVAASGMSALDHYNRYGRFEGMCMPVNVQESNNYNQGG